MSLESKAKTQFQKDMEDPAYCAWANCHCAWMEKAQKLEKVLKIANQRIEAFERVAKAFAEDEAKIAVVNKILDGIQLKNKTELLLCEALHK
jgi:hypothetical protein